LIYNWTCACIYNGLPIYS